MLIDEEFTLKKLEIFLAFMRTGNLARAAAELQTSNVSVHRAIHSLENALRCPLFKHEGRNLTPLESAYVLEERAQKLVQDVVDSVRVTREAAGFSAERFKLDLQSYECFTEGKKLIELDRTEIFTDLVFRPKIVVKANGADPERVRRQVLRALESSQKYSLVANSVKSKIMVEPTIKVIS